MDGKHDSDVWKKDLSKILLVGDGARFEQRKINVQRKLTVGSCFSGIGGLELGLEWTGGFETKWQIEINPYASAVLAKHWPDVKRYVDITTIRLDELERVDLICGGYPCQPFSLAGKRGGAEDQRHLWPDMFRIIRELRPRYALLENVPGHLTLGFGNVLCDLASIGFDAEWSLLPACEVGAAHPRFRLFVIAYSERDGIQRGPVEAAEGKEKTRTKQLAGLLLTGFEHAVSNSRVWRASHGVSHWLDARRNMAIGNAVVPQVAQKVGEMILRFEQK